MALTPDMAKRTMEVWLANGRSRKKTGEIMGLSSASVQQRLEMADRLFGLPIPEEFRRGSEAYLSKVTKPAGEPPTVDTVRSKPRYRVKADGTVLDGAGNPVVPWPVEQTDFEQLTAAERNDAQQGYAPDFNLVHEIPEGMTSRGDSILYGPDGQVAQHWSKSKPAGRPIEESVQLADPKKIESVSTMYDNQGGVTVQWIREKPEEAQKEALWRVFAEEILVTLPRAEPIAGPEHGSDDLLACYPVGDHHLGMLAWDEETGANYDLTIGEKLLAGAIGYLVDATPPCSQALVAFLGDLMHYDSFEAVTPTSRNLLDSDGRYPKMVRAAIRSMRHTIDTALRRHPRVHVIVEIGNHDLSSSVFLMECLAALYENEPRVSVDTSPRHYHYFDFGACLIGTHHGHGAKMDKLPLIMATDQREAWGRTAYRYWFTGHVHHSKQQDFEGCSVESFRVLPPTDAYAAQKGYRSIRDMKAIVMHRQFGEVGRHTVNPAMFRSAA